MTATVTFGGGIQDADQLTLLLVAFCRAPTTQHTKTLNYAPGPLDTDMVWRAWCGVLWCYDVWWWSWCSWWTSIHWLSLER